ncbi:ATP-binding protein, partial [Streptomyces sp. NPDC007095]|uniref:ATP-binding protein n=1 Tax=Streptomyces sp. NPDC007095 TaxID=3154482 RepID=UPI0033C4BD73
MAGPIDTEWVRGGTAARLRGTRECLLGRERELAEIDGCLHDPAGPRLVLIRGEMGVGRSAFAHATAQRLGEKGIAVLPVACVPGDSEHPLLLALRIVMALEEHRSATARPRPGGQSAAEALVAVEQGDRTAMAEALTAALKQPVLVVVLVDDAHNADAESLALLDGVDFEGVAPDVRLLVTALLPATAGSTSRSSPPGRALEELAVGRAAHTIVLPRLGLEEVTAVLARRLEAAPDADLVKWVHHLSRGLPGAFDALLVAWARRGTIRTVDGLAFLNVGTPVPVLPDGDRYVAALYALGESCWTVAGALSILWPLGRPAAALAAASTGLSSDAVDDGIRRLVDEGIMDELPDPAGAAPRGWMFRVPLVAHAVQKRLGPLERSRLSAAAVEALWAGREAADAGASHGHPVTAILDEADAETYLPDRIADAGVRIDRGRAVAELTAAALPLYPDLERRGSLRWLLGAVRLIEQPTARDLAVLRYGQAAFGCGDYPAARCAAESIVRAPAEGLDRLTLNNVATLLVAAVSAQEDWPVLSRMGTARWWNGLPLPALAVLVGRVQALLQMERWHAALTLLSRTEPMWQTDPDSRLMLEWFRRLTEFALGRPEQFLRALTMPEAPELPRNKVFAIAVGVFDSLLGVGDLHEGTALLSARELTPEMLPPSSLFLLRHLQGRWDDALPLARRILVNGGTLNGVPGHHLLPARTAAILLSRGHTTSAGRLISSVRGRPNGALEHVLDHADAEVLRTLGDLTGAEETLRRGLSAADERGSVYGTDELWASLAEVHADAGHTGQAVACLQRLEGLAEQTGNGRTRLLYLLTSVRVLRPDPADARDRLLEAVGLARSRSQPFETAVTLVAAARANAAPATLLHEAYELFGETGAALWR